MTKIEDVKKDNINKVKECFYNGEVWTKNKIAQCTGISKAGTTNILKILCDDNFIIYCGDALSTGGRKSKQYQINQDYFHIGEVILLCKLDGYHFIARTVDLLNHCIDENDYYSSKGNVEELINVVDTLLIKDKRINVLCLSVPGICEDGFLSVCDFKGLEGTDLKKELSFERTVKLVIENDVNIASIGLSHFYQQPHLAFLYQPAVEYVGCGLVIQGKLYNGFSHFAGELRYLPFYDHDIQKQMLKTDPMELLRLQIETVCCVVNPSFVCLCSDVGDVRKIKLTLPPRHCPQIVAVDDMNRYIYDGLYFIVINNQMKGDKNDESRLSCSYSL